MAEVDRDQDWDRIKVWTEYCAKNWTMTGTVEP